MKECLRARARVCTTPHREKQALKQVDLTFPGLARLDEKATLKPKKN